MEGGGNQVEKLRNNTLLIGGILTVAFRPIRKQVRRTRDLERAGIHPRRSHHAEHAAESLNRLHMLEKFVGYGACLAAPRLLCGVGAQCRILSLELLECASHFANLVLSGLESLGKYTW